MYIFMYCIPTCDFLSAYKWEEKLNSKKQQAQYSYLQN